MESIILATILALSLTRFLGSCLLVAQDREEIYLVIGEWDKLYEDYAIDGKFSSAGLRELEKLKADQDPARQDREDLDAGFLTLHVYGPFGGYAAGSSSWGGSMEKLSTNLLALSLHLSQASCSPSSRRNSLTIPTRYPTPSDPGKPCCAGCTCDCRCNKDPTNTRAAPRSQSKSSEPRRGRQEGSRGGSQPREASSKRTASRPSQGSGEREVTPTRDQRSGSGRPLEGHAASIKDQPLPRTVQAQAHAKLSLRGRSTANDQQASTSNIQARAGRSKSRGRDAASPGPPAQAPPTAATLPQASGASVLIPGQQQQHASQGPPRGQAFQGVQPRGDPQDAPVSSRTRQQLAATSSQTHLHVQRPQVPGQPPGALQQPPHDPFQGPGPSYQTQVGPSSYSTPSGAAGPPDVRVPSRPQRQPDETPVKKKKG